MTEQWRWEEKIVATWKNNAEDYFINWLGFTTLCSLFIGFALNYCGLISASCGCVALLCFIGAIYYGLEMLDSKIIRIQVKK